jgi:hypothetical protein
MGRLGLVIDVHDLEIIGSHFGSPADRALLEVERVYGPNHRIAQATRRGIERRREDVRREFERDQEDYERELKEFRRSRPR